MAEMALSDVRHVVWGETAKLALARGVASSIVVTLLGLLLGFFRGSSAVNVLAFFLFWPLVVSIGAPIYAYMLKGISAILRPFGGGIVTLSCNILTYLTVGVIACGDPLVFVLTQSAPRILNVPDFKLINPKILIFVLENGEANDVFAEAPSLDSGNLFDHATSARRESGDSFRSLASEHSQTAASGFTASQDSGGIGARERLSEWIKRAQSDEEDVLGQLAAGQFDGGNENDLRYVRAVALATVAIKYYLNEGGGAEHLLGVEKGEPPSLITGDALNRALESLYDISEIERVDQNYVFGTHPHVPEGAPQLSFCFGMADEARPGVVQQVLGWTTIGILGKRAFQIRPDVSFPVSRGISREIPEDLVNGISDVRFQSDLPCRTLIVVGCGIESGIRFLQGAALELDHRTVSKLGDANLFGWIKLYEDGTFQFQPSEPREHQRSSWPLTGKSASSLRLNSARSATAVPTSEQGDHSSPWESKPKWGWAVGALCAILALGSIRSCMVHRPPTAPVPSLDYQAAAQSPPENMVTTATGATSTYAASFRCAEAKAWAETQVCTTQALADADTRQATLYSDKMALASGQDRTNLRAAQRAWIRGRNRCASLSCVRDSYSTRISQLESWTPAHSSDDPGALQMTYIPNARSTRVSSQGQTGAVRGVLVTCILSTGEELKVTRADCRERNGVIY